MKRKPDKRKAAKAKQTASGRTARRTSTTPRPAPTSIPVASAPDPAPIDFTSSNGVEPIPHLLLKVTGALDEGSLPLFFERAGQTILDAGQRRILVDLRACSVRLSIADMHGLVKMAAGRFAGLVDRLALVLTPSDILAEKFFEPALTSRGVPTLATTNYDDAVDWLAAKLRFGR